MKLAIIVGHTEADEGALSVPMNVQEYTWNKDLADRILAVDSEVERKMFLRDHVGISGAYRASDDWGADLSVELHFNSADSKSATGSAVLYFPGSKKGKRFAGHIFEGMSGALGLRDWPKGTGGVVTPFQASGKAQRGLTSLRAGRAPATLLEPFFGSNPEDCATAQANKSAYATSVVRAAEQFFDA